MPKATDRPATDRPTAERLIEVAGEIFARKGSSATVREICSAAGCSIAAINYYFGDKQQLYVRCIEEACARKRQLFPVPSMDNVPSGDDAESARLRIDLLRSFLRAVTRRVVGESDLPWQNTLMMREILAPTEHVAERLAEYIKPDFQRLDRLLSEVIGRKRNCDELRRSLATQILARTMFLRTGKNLRAILGLDFPANEDPELVADAICDSIIQQIQAIQQRDPKQGL